MNQNDNSCKIKFSSWSSKPLSLSLSLSLSRARARARARARSLALFADFADCLYLHDFQSTLFKPASSLTSRSVVWEEEREGRGGGGGWGGSGRGDEERSGSACNGKFDNTTAPWLRFRGRVVPDTLEPTPSTFKQFAVREDRRCRKITTIIIKLLSV